MDYLSVFSGLWYHESDPWDRTQPSARLDDAQGRLWGWPAIRMKKTCKKTLEKENVSLHNLCSCQDLINQRTVRKRFQLFWCVTCILFLLLILQGTFHTSFLIFPPEVCCLQNNVLTKKLGQFLVKVQYTINDVENDNFWKWFSSFIMVAKVLLNVMVTNIKQK